MIDISAKRSVCRSATASGTIHLKKGTIDAIRSKHVKKGDVLEVARVAGIQAVKRASELIPHCHPITIEACEVWFEIAEGCVIVHCRVKAEAKTGVEMEALTGVSICLLTIWDMVKSLEKDDQGQYPDTRITDIIVNEKIKGPGDE